MAKRYSGEWEYTMFFSDGQSYATRQWLPLGYSQSHYRKVLRERARRAHNGDKSQ